MDPFQQNDPFQHMERQMRNMQRMMDQAFGGNSMFGAGGMGGGFLNDPFFQSPMGGMMQGGMPSMQGGMPTLQAPQVPRQRQHNPPVVEELEEDDEEVEYARAAGQPVVEEPDEDNTQNQQYQQPQQFTDGGRDYNRNFNSDLSSNRSAMSNMFMGGMGNMPQSSSFQSYSYSSYSSGGPGGMSYQETSHTNMGPGGVMESRRTVHDSRQGKEQLEVTRGLQGRGRTVQRTRYQDGRQEALDTLHNIAPEQAPQFDTEWQQQASRHLPNRLGSSRSNNQRQFRQIGDGSDPAAYPRRI
eukprot:TRINITY_DN94_c1_g1_i2.p1 TRINITY_DN94_c1_g1~~TRINITY_DN94_c1_g1_i2.p1  ORF type:complete len:331 (-),score=58.64 TRINITY_DN94_c1_g1_i2:251-1144(-)